MTGFHEVVDGLQQQLPEAKPTTTEAAAAVDSNRLEEENAAVEDERRYTEEEAAILGIKIYKDNPDNRRNGRWGKRVGTQQISKKKQQPVKIDQKESGEDERSKKRAPPQQVEWDPLTGRRRVQPKISPDEGTN